MDTEGAGGSDRAHEVDGLGGLQPRCLHRYRERFDRLVGHVQGVARVVEAVLDDVAEVGAGWLVAVAVRMTPADGSDLVTGGGEPLPRGVADDGQAADVGRLWHVDRDTQPGQPEHVDVVAVLVGDDNRVGADECPRLAPHTRIDDENPTIGLLDANTRVGVLDEPHAVTIEGLHWGLQPQCNPMISSAPLAISGGRTSPLS